MKDTVNIESSHWNYLQFMCIQYQSDINLYQKCDTDISLQIIPWNQKCDIYHSLQMLSCNLVKFIISWIIQVNYYMIMMMKYYGTY